MNEKPIDYNATESDFEYYGNPKVIANKDFDKLSLITYDALGLTVDRVKNELLGLGEDLIDPTTGKEYPDSFYEQMIDKSVSKTEKEFDIVVRPRINHERLDFNQTEVNSYMFLRTYERPIIQVTNLRFIYTNSSHYDFPDPWLKVTSRYGQLEVQPNFLMGVNSNFNLANLAVYDNSTLSDMNLGDLNSYGSLQFAPQMIGCTYIAGMLPQDPKNRGINRDMFIQPDLIAYIAKDAAIEVLERWGRLILGAGIAGYSISMDGISSSIDATQSAENTGSTADIKLLQTDMKDIRNALKSYYGYNLGVLS